MPIYPLQRFFLPPKLYGLSICRGAKLRKKQQLYPQFQNSVGTLLYIMNKHCKALASSFLNEFKYIYNNNKDFIKYTLLTGNICIFDLKQNDLYQIWPGHQIHQCLDVNHWRNPWGNPSVDLDGEDQREDKINLNQNIKRNYFTTLLEW